MSMTTALSGLMAAQTEISATSHNIANVGTMGFRGSRVEFSDVFSSSPFSPTRTAVGSGTMVQRVAQDFSQGNVVTTGNLLDMAIEGQGFFALQQLNEPASTATAPIFSRAGAFQTNDDGFVVDSSNRALMCWPVAKNGVPLSRDLSGAMPLKIPMERGEARATGTVTLSVALPADETMAGQQAAVPPAAAFDPADPTTYAHATLVPAFDGNGRPVEAMAYFVRTASPTATTTETTYTVHMMVDGAEFGPATTGDVSFDEDGALIGTGLIAFESGDRDLTVDLTGSSLGTGSFAVLDTAHDGAAPEKLSNLDIDPLGSVWATYGTGERIALGQVVLATFQNPQGLRQLGKSGFAQSSDSGPPQTGTPGTAGFGQVRSGALERSNVELTEELVNLISAQRNYQANAKAMETSTSLMQTIMNIRS